MALQSVGSTHRRGTILAMAYSDTYPASTPTPHTFIYLHLAFSTTVHTNTHTHTPINPQCKISHQIYATQWEQALKLGHLLLSNQTLKLASKKGGAGDIPLGNVGRHFGEKRPPQSHYSNHRCHKMKGVAEEQRNLELQKDLCYYKPKQI